MLALELVVFDLAGTTIQASELVPMALRQALSLPGIKLSDAQIESLRGRSKREAIVELVNRHLGGGAGPRLAESIYAEASPTAD